MAIEEDFAEELVPCTEPEDGHVQASSSSRSKRPLALAAAAAVSLFAGAAAWLGHGGAAAKMSAGAELQRKEATWKQVFPSQCESMEVDMDSSDNSGFGVGLDHIPDPETCCAMCQGVAMCQSFTWVKDAGLEGCPSQCWLKGGPGVKAPKKGFVSGAPPQRKQLGVVPATGSGPGTSLFCFSLMLPNSDEEKLITWQLEKGASIFACDDYAVYSNVTKEIGGLGLWTTKIDSDLKCGFGGDSGTALNSWIFIALFDQLLDDGLWKQHDWSVKADPDAVFFPDRLARILQEHKGAAYINNCKYGMHGPIEVFGKQAMTVLDAEYKASWDGKAPKSCVEDLDLGLWGEDMFLDQCLQKLNAGLRPLDDRLMCEDHCECPGWYWCNNGTDRVSYHPFKTVQSYANCMANAGVNP